MTDVAETVTAASNEDISDLLQFMWGYSEDNIFTEEQEAMERASLTQEERMEALSDMFGEMSLSSSSSTAKHYHQRKRTRRDLDTLSVMFLVNQMRVEIQEMSQDKKQALVEAQSKCHRQEEFSDDRLEQFLRFEGMNPKVKTLSSPFCLFLTLVHMLTLVHCHLYSLLFSLEHSALSNTGTRDGRSLAKTSSRFE
jgi:hypothetical protein